MLTVRFFFFKNGPFSPIFYFSTFIFLFFSFFLSFRLFPLFSLFLSFSHLVLIQPNSPVPPLPFLLNFHFFFFFFIIPFYFLSFISPFDTCINMSHLSKCYVSLATPHGHHVMCPSPKVPSGIYMVMSCVTRHLVSRKT